MVNLLIFGVDEGMDRFLRELCLHSGDVRVTQRGSLQEHKPHAEDQERADYCIVYLPDDVLYDKQKFSSLVHSCSSKWSKKPEKERNCYRITTAKEAYDIPYEDILFIESDRKKSIIHTKDGPIELAKPLYRLREVLPRKNFVQTHRSFIVNLENVTYVDKTKDPWEVSFRPSQGIALISRGYRKEFNTNLENFLKERHPAQQGKERGK